MTKRSRFPQVEDLAVLHHVRFEGGVEQVAKEIFRRRGGIDHRLGTVFQHESEGTGVVRFRMVDDEVVHIGRVDELFHLGEKLFGPLFLDRVDNGDLVPALDQVGVVGGSLFGGEEVVEGTEIGIFRADPIDIVPYFNHIFHCASP